MHGFTGYLHDIGVRDLPPSTCPFDPGVAPVVLESHLAQSAHLMLSVKLSMACWMIADESSTRRKVSAAHAAGVQVQTGGGPYEVAAAQRRLGAYLDLCADVGFDAIECGAGFTDPGVSATGVVTMASERGMAVEYELGKKHTGPFDAREVTALVLEGQTWLHAGARRLIVEARESAVGVGLFDGAGQMNRRFAEQIVAAFGLGTLVFEAPSKASQFTLLDEFGPHVQLGNVPLDEVLRVEIYRRGLHSDAFERPGLRPAQVPQADRA